MPRKTKCRQCGEIFAYESIKDSPNYPFCSARCRLLDLGEWFDGKHKIEEPAPGTAPPEPDEDTPLR